MLTALAATRDVVDANVDELGRIDAVAGDGDHGIGMQRGATAAASAAAAALDRGAGAGTVLAHAGDAWSDRAGGTSGAIWGLILRTLADGLRGHRRAAAAHGRRAVQNAAHAVMDFGKAKVGDKTMVDVLVPFAEALDRAVAAGDPLPAAWSGAAESPPRPPSTPPTWSH